GDGFLELLFLERLAVPVLLAFGERDALALFRARQNHRRLAFRGACRFERVEDRGDVVAVDDDRAPTERLPAALELAHVVLPHRRLALTEPIDVRDGAQAVELVARPGVRRLPYPSFRRFAVAEQDVGAVVRSDAAGVQRAADRRADALAERAGGDVDERQPRRRMAFEIRAELAQRQQLAAIERARRRPRGVKDR